MGPARRALPLTVIFSLLASLFPAAALGVTTQQEIRAGQAEDEQITSSQVVETDPLLNAYVQSIANKLWLQVARKDLPYNIKIIKASDINSFATEGGFVYIDEGLIDFVQSDDEFAGVIGHETGHIERRHVVTLSSKAEAVQILAALASIFSPFLMPASSLLGDLVTMKMSREDELEADRTGLQLMSRAGYDPDAMLTMMRHMVILSNDQSELADKYFEDHPDPEARIAHLLGYPELNPKLVTQQQLLVQADSDAERARYSYAAIKLEKILQKDPDNVDALLELAQVQIALGLTSKSQQTLALAKKLGTPEARAVVAMREAEIREMEARQADLVGVDPDYSRLSAEIDDARQRLSAVGRLAQPQLQPERESLQSIESQLQDISDRMPQVSGSPQGSSRATLVMEELAAISRAVGSTVDDTTQVFDNVGSLQLHKESGLLTDAREIIDEMAEPLAIHPVPVESIPILASYPEMLHGLALAEDNVQEALQTAKAATNLLQQGTDELQDSIRPLEDEYSGSGTGASAQDIGSMEPGLRRALAIFNDAATTASQGAQLYNMARSRALSVRITLLGFGDSPQRYATLRYALQQRFGMSGIEYATMRRDGITPGDVAAATILAADVHSTPQTIVDESLQTKTPIIDLANEHGMHAWPLEIFMRLVYLDYTDDPVTEMETRAPLGAAGDD
jgi:Zn-dependent protease with chaperone function